MAKQSQKEIVEDRLDHLSGWLQALAYRVYQLEVAEKRRASTPAKTSKTAVFSPEEARALLAIFQYARKRWPAALPRLSCLLSSVKE